MLDRGDAHVIFVCVVRREPTIGRSDEIVRQPAGTRRHEEFKDEQVDERYIRRLRGDDLHSADCVEIVIGTGDGLIHDAEPTDEVLGGGGKVVEREFDGDEHLAADERVSARAGDVGGDCHAEGSKGVCVF